MSHEETTQTTRFVPRSRQKSQRRKTLVEASGIQGGPEGRNVADLLDYIRRRALKDAAEKILKEYPSNMDRPTP